MSLCEIAVERPQRWDEPFGDAMRGADVDQLLKIEPFSRIDPQLFPPALPLRGILKNDARICQYQDGDLVVREGDYGHSAFLVLQGKVRVVLEGLAPEALGRPRPAPRRGLWQSLIRLWRNPRLPEVRRRLRYDSELIDDNRTEVADLTQTRVFLQDVPRVLDATRTLTLQKGEFFGELAALTRTPRTATVFADHEAWLLEIRWQGLRDLMRRTDALRQHIEQLYRDNSLRVHLRETPLFSRLPVEEIEAVAEATVFETHGHFQWQASDEATIRQAPAEVILNEPLIAEEGAPADGLLLIRSGFARLSRRHGHGHRTTAYLGKGQIYALAEVLETAQTGEPVPLVNSLRALGYVDVLRIPLEVLQQHVLPLVPQRLLDELTRQSGAASGTPSRVDAAADTPLLEFVVERRLNNGQQTMVIDLDRCTRCDDCVRACAATHDNNPRFVRHGPRLGSTLVAQACMHCVDPVCMIGCPTGAIGRDLTSGILRINDLTCIGCSTCANSCPYGNIRMAEARDPQGAVYIDASTQQPILKATKCDLCADQASGPACQRACPHDALVRMDLGKLGELSQWLSR